MMTEKIALFTNLSGSKRNVCADPTEALRKHALSKRTAPAPGIGRKVTLADGTETTQVLSDAKIEQERKLRGNRLPYGFGTAKYNELMARHRALKQSQERERNARFEARAKRRELSPEQEALVSKELALAGGHPVDFRGRLLEPEQ